MIIESWDNSFFKGVSRPPLFQKNISSSLTSLRTLVLRYSNSVKVDQLGEGVAGGGGGGQNLRE